MWTLASSHYFGKGGKDQGLWQWTATKVNKDWLSGPLLPNFYHGAGTISHCDIGTVESLLATQTSASGLFPVSAGAKVCTYLCYAAHGVYMYVRHG